MPTHTPTSTMSASLSVENKQQNPVSLLNQYRPGLNYQVVGEYGLPHLKTFTVELVVDDQVGAKMLFEHFSLHLHIIWLFIVLLCNSIFYTESHNYRTANC